MHLRALIGVAISVGAWAQQFPDDPFFEIHFEPLGLDGPGPRDFFDHHGDDLGAIFNSLLSGGRSSFRKRRSRGSLLDGGDGFTIEQSFGGSSDGWAQPVLFRQTSTMPIDSFNDLFPMSMPPAQDPFLDSMLQHVSQSFKDTIAPALQQAVAGKRGKPGCNKDAQELCKGASSRLHCLGLHAPNVSDACRKEVGKSVPFLCSRALDQWCDPLQRGILPCLADHLKDLEEPCRDAVLLTHQVIAKVKTQRTTILNTITGENQTHTPTPLKGEEAKLDLQLTSVGTKEKTEERRESSALPAAPVFERSSFAASVLPAPAPSEQVRPALFQSVFLLCAGGAAAYVIKTRYISPKKKTTGSAILLAGMEDENGNHIL